LKHPQSNIVAGRYAPETRYEGTHSPLSRISELLPNLYFRNIALPGNVVCTGFAYQFQWHGWRSGILTVPESAEMSGRLFTRLETSSGYFVLPSFGGLALTAHAPYQVMGVSIASPEMMALANMLEHPGIGPETMSGRIGGREIKRSNKDLGRVLAIAYLAENKEEDALMTWPYTWFTVLRSVFRSDFRDRAIHAGAGIRTLISPSHVEDLEEAHHTCVYGLLASNPPTPDQFKITGERLWSMQWNL